MSDGFNRKWITENSLEVLQDYRLGEITIRGLYYRLVALGMTNSIRHYKRVQSAMVEARKRGLVEYEQFADHDREVIGSTQHEDTDVKDSIEQAKRAITSWMNLYFKNHWEQQYYYVEVWIEKKALIGAFESTCEKNRVALAPCKGYPSLTFLNEAKARFRAAKQGGKEPVILYFGDYDPSGEDIPRSIEENLYDLGVTVKVDRRALLEQQVIDWNLPPAPAKATDSRTANWDGLGQVELDAVEPRKLGELLQEAIDEYFDEDIRAEVKELEEIERAKYRKKLKKYVKKLK